MADAMSSEAAVLMQYIVAPAEKDLSMHTGSSCVDNTTERRPGALAAASRSSSAPLLALSSASHSATNSAGFHSAISSSASDGEAVAPATLMPTWVNRR